MSASESSCTGASAAGNTSVNVLGGSSSTRMVIFSPTWKLYSFASTSLGLFNSSCRKAAREPSPVPESFVQACLSPCVVLAHLDFSGCQLTMNQIRVVAALPQKFFMGSPFYNGPLIDHQDQIGVANGTQAMGDDNLCAAQFT